MKKLSIVLAVVLVLATVLATTVSAGALKVWENSPLAMKEATPTVDGSVDSSYAGPVYLNELTSGYFWSTNPLTSNANIYFAHDNNGIYFAAQITEGVTKVDIATLSQEHADIYWKDEVNNCYMISNGKTSAKFCDLNGNLLMADGVTLASETGNSFVQATGEDDIEDAGQTYGFNGDVFGVSFDPAGQASGTDAGGNPIPSKGIYAAGYTMNSDKAPAYLVSMVNGTAQIYKNVYLEDGTVDTASSGVITDAAKATCAAKTTSYGWDVEGFVSWDEIIANIKITFPDVELTKADILAEKAFIRASAIYQDRFNDAEAGEVATWGRYITVLADTATGASGAAGSGTDVGSMGLKLFVGTVPSDVNNKGSGAGNIGGAATPGSGDGAGDSGSDNTTSTAKKAATGSSTGGEAAQTLDAGMVVALGALAASGLGVYVTKKRK